jgi:hypothetical protein
VAATVAGGNNVISGLSRIAVADDCYQRALGEAEERARQFRVSKNLFANQLTVLQSFGADNRLPVDRGLPAISYSFVAGLSRSRINFRNQWASHPTLEERKRSIDALATEQEADTASAWTLFADAEALQQRMTAHLYRNANFKEETRVYEGVEFEREFLEEKQKYALPAAYRGFYSERLVEIEGWDLEGLGTASGQLGTASGQFGTVTKFDHLFNDAAGQLQRSIAFNNKDIQVAMAIKQKKIDVKSFDFDGVKYDMEDGKMIAEQLKREVAEQRKRQIELDKQAFIYFVRAAGPRREELIAAYREFQRVKRQHDEFTKAVWEVMKKIQPFYGGTIGIDAVERIVRELKAKEEVDLKNEYRRLLENVGFGDGALRVRMQQFIDGNYAYFVNRKYVMNEVEDMKQLASTVSRRLDEYRFRVYKKMLEVQLDVAPPAKG